MFKSAVPIFAGLILTLTLSSSLEARQPPSGTRPIMPQPECVQRILEGNLDKMSFDIIGFGHLDPLFGSLVMSIHTALDKRGAYYGSEGSDFFVSINIELDSGRHIYISPPDDGRMYKLAVLQLKFYCLNRDNSREIRTNAMPEKSVMVKFDINMWRFVKDDLNKTIQNFVPLIDKALPKK